jgi:hypothetical protein
VKSAGEVGYPSRVSRACPESSTLCSIRPEPFGSELKAELLMAEGRPKGAVEGKGKASPVEAGRGKYSPGPRKGQLESTEAKGQWCSPMKNTPYRSHEIRQCWYYLRIIIIPTIIMIAPTNLSQLILSENKNRPPRRAINGNADVMGITREIIPYLMA